MSKTYDKKQDFIQLLASMSHNDINEYIKRHGKKPKPVLVCRVVKEDNDGWWFRLYNNQIR